MRYYLLYDEDCALCLRFQKAIQGLDDAGRIEAVGFHDRRIPEIVPRMGPQELVNNFHLVFPDGSVKSGSQALPDLLCLLPGLRFVGWILKAVPGTRRLSDRIYAWIALKENVIPPYGFYPCLKPCPACGGKLLSLTPLRKEFVQGPLQHLGVSCFCQQCSRRYRATSVLNYSAVAWLGPIGRWLWWRLTTLESTTPASEG